MIQRHLKIESISTMLFALFLFTILTSAAPLKFSGYIPHALDTALFSREYNRIATTIGYDITNDTLPLEIHFYRASEQSKTGIRLPEWGGGGAIGADSIVIPIDKQSAFYREDIIRIIVHEMVHCAIARAYGTFRVPRWFHEGLAMSLAGELSFEQQLQLSRAILLQALVPLDSIEYVNRFSRWRAEVAYSQCHFAVQFLITTYGIDLIPELLHASRSQRRFESSCVLVFGLTTKELQLLLDKEMSSKYRILFIIGDYSLVWAGIFVLAIVAFIVTTIRKKRKLRLMEQEEMVESCDDPEPEPVTPA